MRKPPDPWYVCNYCRRSEGVCRGEGGYHLSEANERGIPIGDYDSPHYRCPLCDGSPLGTPCEACGGRRIWAAPARRQREHLARLGYEPAGITFHTASRLVREGYDRLNRPALGEVDLGAAEAPQRSSEGLDRSIPWGRKLIA